MHKIFWAFLSIICAICIIIQIHIKNRHAYAGGCPRVTAAAQRSCRALFCKAAFHKLNQAVDCELLVRAVSKNFYGCVSDNTKR
jgi:hypothetical protein